MAGRKGVRSLRFPSLLCFPLLTIAVGTTLAEARRHAKFTRLLKVSQTHGKLIDQIVFGFRNHLNKFVFQIFKILFFIFLTSPL
jgi:hypothetical protein